MCHFMCQICDILKLSLGTIVKVLYFEITMNVPLFPNLKPRLMHSSWFDVDQPCDDEEEVSQLEREHQNWVILKNSA